MSAGFDVLSESEGREFTDRWLPVGDTELETDGVCTVQLRDGLIARNEVFFDRSELLEAMQR